MLSIELIFIDHKLLFYGFTEQKWKFILKFT